MGLKENLGRRIVPWLVGGLLFQAVSSGCSFTPSAKGALFDFEPSLEGRINTSIQAGEYDVAGSLLNENPQLDDCYEAAAWGTLEYFLAMDLEESGNLEEAKDHYRDAAIKFLGLRDSECIQDWGVGEKKELYEYISKSCNEIGEYQTALEALQDWSRLGVGVENLYEFYIEQGDAYLGLGDFENAGVAYSNALGLRRTDEARTGYERASSE